MQSSLKNNYVISALTAVYDKILAANDKTNAAKLKQLIIKEHKKEFVIAFCGHFSAGKSSMINFLLEEDILPSSPIPTSANTVKIQKGSNFAKVLYHTEPPVIFPAPYDYHAVKSFCKDGDRVEAITISSSDFPLPENCTIMDTPGIDSTDDAHRVATESAIHLADIVFYVMDYNHVQSEVNFMFTKELLDANKKVYLIINMIDKHEETELSFADFKESVSAAFEHWDVVPEGFYFTSLRDLNNSDNEITSVKDFIFQSAKTASTTFSVIEAAKKIIEDHLSWLLHTQEDRHSESIELLSVLHEEEREAIPLEFNRLSSEKEAITNRIAHIRGDFEAGLKTILKNAYLMPASTRDMAQAYLEANQPDFKIGILFSKKKTEMEKEKRMSQLLADIQEKAQTQLEWHVKELAVKTAAKAEIHHPSVDDAAQNIKVEISSVHLEKPLKKQVQITGEYILNYTDELATSIKKIAKTEADEFEQTLLSQLTEETEKTLIHTEKELENYKRLKFAQETVTNIQADIDTKRNELSVTLSGEGAITANPEQLLRQWESEEDSGEIKFTNQLDFTEKGENRLNSVTEETESSSKTVLSVEQRGKEKLQHTALALTTAAELAAPLKGFQSLEKELREKAARLNGQTYTVALFGAFSAGKSSFANALMGSSVLPVSPNPTTAAINKIMAADSKHPHETAVVKMKSVHMLLEDVVLALSIFQMTAENLDEAHEKATKLIQADKTDEKGKTQLSFLRAFAAGYPEYKEVLGQELSVDLSGFKSFAANEAQSCFVDLIELYYNCELTEQGMILVDTPGADSINARHTGAAFEYIKNSDAILFVTYYNHPFSKADREFLIQLGRVKDSFAMDKMFFIVNAADLAQTEAELEEVLQYIREQLNGFGIRFPKLFSLTSKGALTEKKGEVFTHHFLKNSGIEEFQNQFESFIETELTLLAIQSAADTVKRTAERLRDVLHTAQQDEEAKRRASAELKSEHEALMEIMNGHQHDAEKRRLKKEIEELTYYSKQRVFYRFNDFFKESFNPAVLKDDGRDLKSSLKQALAEFLGSLGFDLSQEMRATYLRAELHLAKILAEKQQALHKEFTEIRQTIGLASFEPAKATTMEFLPAFEMMDEANFKKDLALFKNPKSFFERNEKQRMSDSLKESLDTPAMDYASHQAERMVGFFAEQLSAELERLKHELTEELADLYAGLHAALENTVDLGLYERTLKQIEDLDID